MALFALNTGLRDQEICAMKWEDECRVNGLDASVFIISETRAKNEHERIVPLNSVAQSIVASRRGNQSDYVFTDIPHPLSILLILNNIIFC